MRPQTAGEREGAQASRKTVRLLRTIIGDDIADAACRRMVGTPSSSAAPWWIRGCAYVELTVDSAATENVASQVLEPFMTKAQNSELMISGSLPGGGGVPGRFQGEVTIEALSVLEGCPCPCGTLTATWETAKDMPYVLRLSGASPSGRTPLFRYYLVSRTPPGTMTERKHAISGA